MHRCLVPIVSRGMKMSSTLRQTVVTGIQPTGYPHLGNYLGMIKPCVRLQSDERTSRFLLIIADLHALTKPETQNDLKMSTFQLASVLIACGINPVTSASEFVDNALPTRGKSVLFPQSSVRGHCELTWILSSKCSVNVCMLLFLLIKKYIPNLYWYKFSTGKGIACAGTCYTRVCLAMGSVALKSERRIWGWKHSKKEELPEGRHRGKTPEAVIERFVTPRCILNVLGRLPVELMFICSD